MLSQTQIRREWAPPCRGPWVRVPANGAGSWVVRPAAAEAFKALATVQRAFGYVTRRDDTGAYVCRTNVSGTATSTHAYGISADSNWRSNSYGQMRRTDRPAEMNRAVVAIRTNNGKQVFNWGGYWSGNKDPMHDEIVCAPRDLATGIDWTTVAGHPSYRGGVTKVPLPPTATRETDMTGWVRHKSGAIARVTDETFHPLSAIEWIADQLLYAQATGRKLDAAQVGPLLWNLNDDEWRNFQVGRRYVPPVA